MAQKRGNKTNIIDKINPLNFAPKSTTHPIAQHEWRIGQRASDKLTSGMGSWTFIILFLVFLTLWMIVNTIWIVFGNTWDPKPFIMLNLVLSCLAALQAPIILMSQNRQSQKDRLRADYDYQVNRKAEKEITEVKKQLNRIEKNLNKKSKQ